MSVRTGSPAFAGDDNFDEGHVRRSFPRPPDALVDEAVAGDFLGPVDVAQVDHHRALPSTVFSRAKSSARNCSHSVTITSAEAPSAQS